jgi:uncharacterized Zn-binding protein involved in type VI secretion
VGDPTNHGTPLSPGTGSTKVFIGGQPAWRAVIDVHTCPLFDGPKAHGGGVVAKGSSKVFIDRMPAAREGDQVVEVGQMNGIKKGFTKVQIGG